MSSSEITEDDLRLALAEAGAAISDGDWDHFHNAINDVRGKAQRADLFRGGDAE